MDAYALALKFQTEGFDDVFRKLDAVDAKGKRVAETGTKAGASIERIGHKAAGVAIALSGMETVGVSAMEKIAHGATNIGFMFGPQGAIIGALGIVAVMMVNVFTQARKEMEATDKRARDLLRSLSLESGVSTASRLYGGDPFAKAGSPEALGLAGARARQAELQRQAAAAGAIRFGASGLVIGGGVPKAVQEELDAITDWLKEADPLYKRVVARTEELAAAAVEVNQNLIEIAETERKRKEAADAYVPGVRGKMPGISDTEGASSKFRSREEREALQLDPIKARAMVTITEAQKDMIAMVDNTAAMMRESIIMTFGEAIYEGLREGFHGGGIGGIFKSFGKTILGAMGGLFKQLGGVWLAYGATMFKWSFALWNPATSGIAALAIGAALMALGGALGAVGNSGGGGYGEGAGSGGGFNSRQEETTRVRLMPGWASANGVEQRSANNYQFTIIGANDPKAQREIAQLVANAERRGL